MGRKTCITGLQSKNCIIQNDERFKNGHHNCILKVSVNVINVDDNAPEFGKTSEAKVSEGAVIGTAVVKFNATDRDGGTLTFSIKGGNTGDAFRIDSRTGNFQIYRIFCIVRFYIRDIKIDSACLLLDRFLKYFFVTLTRHAFWISSKKYQVFMFHSYFFFM